MADPKERSGEEKYIEWIIEEAYPEYDPLYPYEDIDD